MKNKETFLFYLEWIDIFKELNEQQTYKLFNHIMDYVTDKNPETDELWLRLAFAPIKTTLKKDLVKWKETCEKNSENGKKGGAPKGTIPHNKKKLNSEPTASLTNPTKAIKADNEYEYDYSKNNHNEYELSKGIVKGNQPIESLGSVETSGVSIDTQSPQGFLPKGYVDVEDDVTSKGYKKFLESFPPNKRRHSDEAYQIWESLTQGEKQQLFKHLKSHISKLKTEGKEQFLKNSEKYLESGEWKNIPVKSGSKPGQSISKGGLTTTINFGSYNFYNWYSKEVNLPFNASFDDWRRHFQNQSAENQTNYQEEFRKFEEHRLNLITQNR